METAYWGVIQSVPSDVSSDLIGRDCTILGKGDGLVSVTTMKNGPPDTELTTFYVKEIDLPTFVEIAGGGTLFQSNNVH